MNMELKHGGLVQMIFLSNWVICRFQPLIFRSVNSDDFGTLRYMMSIRMFGGVSFDKNMRNATERLNWTSPFMLVEW